MCLDQLSHAGLEDKIISFFIFFWAPDCLISPLTDGPRERKFQAIKEQLSKPYSPSLITLHCQHTSLPSFCYSFYSFGFWVFSAFP